MIGHLKMDPVRQTEKKYCARALTSAIFVGFALMLLSFKPVGKGLILGTLFSILNFILIGETLPSRIHASRKKAALFAFGSILFRYLILAVPLFVALRNDAFNLFGVIAGLFMVQAMILADQATAWISSTTKGQGRIWKN